MPPHCDSMDGPVVLAARRALETNDVRVALPFVPKESERDVIAAFEKVAAVRSIGPAAANLADLYFFETVVRLHRAGEGAPFTGLKPAGLSESPAIALAEQAVDSGTADQLLEFLSSTLQTHIEKKLALVSALKSHDPANVDDAREYVEAMLGFIVNAHKLHECMLVDPRVAHREHGAN